jgi:zinc protease
MVYGLPEQGTRESLESLTPDKLREYYNRYFQPANFTVAVVGDVDAAALRARLEKVSATSSGTRTAPPAPVFAMPRQTDPPLVVKQMETEFAWVFIGFAVTGYSHADYAALRVLAAALGEAPNGRLPRRLLAPASVGEDALALQVSAVITPRRYASEFILFGQADVSNVDDAKDAILDEVRKLRETPLSQSELTRARNFVLGSWAVDREGLRERAFEVALAPALDAPVDTTLPARVNAVTADDVRRIAQKYLQAYTVALIMPEE